MSEAIKTIGVVGAGTMGNGIAQVFAQAGFAVQLVDVAQPMLDRARERHREEPRQVRREGQADRRRSRRERSAACPTTTRLERSPLPTTSSKRSSRTSRPSGRSSRASTRSARPHAILASNTSSISITVLGAATKRPDQVLGMHFMNPVPLMTLVELIRGQATSDASMRVATELCARARQDRRRGGRLSRLHRQPHPDADAERGVLRGDGRRRHARSDRRGDEGRDEPPDGTADAGRLHRPRRLPRRSSNVLHDGLGDPKYRPCPLLRRMVAAGQLGRKSGRGFYVYA